MIYPVRKMTIVVAIMFLVMAIVLCSGFTKVNGSVKKTNANAPVKVAILIYDYNDAFLSLVRKDFEKIQNENKQTVEFTYYDGKNNQSIQNQTLDKILQEKSADVILLNLVNPNTARNAINKIKEYNIPVVLFNREPQDINDIKSYNKAYYVGADEAQGGTLEGNIIVDLWKNNKKVIDRNGDNKLQYIMIIGQNNNRVATLRTKYSELALDEAKINNEELASTVCDWNRDMAKLNMNSLLLKNLGRVEAIISNNDDMAIGAIQALQAYSYNKGENSKTVPVVGIDAIPEAQELIKKGEMAGTVFQSTSQIAKVCYDIGINLANKKQPLDGTNYKFDNSGVAVRINFENYNP